MLENITVTSQTTASILSHVTERMESHIAEQTQMIKHLVATQTNMAESLEQMVSLLQIQNERIASLTDCQCHQEETTSYMYTTVTKPNEPTIQTQSQHETTTSSSVLTTVMTTNEPITQTLSLPADCSNVSAADNHGSGVYTIDPRDGLESFNAYCDMDTNTYGWTVFQKRFDGSTDFFRGWDDYEHGFGNLAGEFWLGLQQVHRLTSSGRWTLRIDMEDLHGNIRYAEYEDFQIGDAASFYQLSVGAFNGTVGYDALTPKHDGQPFSTKDSDHDRLNCTSGCEVYGGSCAKMYEGAWWYNHCHQANLNGSTSPAPIDSFFCWNGFVASGDRCTKLKRSEMKIRRVQ